MSNTKATGRKHDVTSVERLATNEKAIQGKGTVTMFRNRRSSCFTTSYKLDQDKGKHRLEKH